MIKFECSLLFSVRIIRAVTTFLPIFRSNCLQNEPDISSGNHITAGHVYSADEQCNMTYGNDAVLCRVSFTHLKLGAVK